MNVLNSFNLTDKVIVVTGAAGLLGYKHCEAIAEAGGIPILLDINETKLIEAYNRLVGEEYQAYYYKADITSLKAMEDVKNSLLDKFGKVDGLVNNAAANPMMESSETGFSRLENFSLEQWDFELNVGLKGAFICSRVFGSSMEKSQSGGVVVNISSDLGIIAPDQRLYKNDKDAPDKQPVKPVTYSVVKHGLIGLSKYLSTYWKKVRVNTLVPAGVYNNQPDEFVSKLEALIPMERMAKKDEYKASLIYLLSDASSYMTGHQLVVDGGRSVW